MSKPTTRPEPPTAPKDAPTTQPAAAPTDAERAAMKARAIAILSEDNPSPMSVAACRIYADAFLERLTAQRNIDVHGAVVFHPRTGAPIDNPYIHTRDAADAKMLRIRLRAERLWAELG